MKENLKMFVRKSYDDDGNCFQLTLMTEKEIHLELQKTLNEIEEFVEGYGVYNPRVEGMYSIIYEAVDCDDLEKILKAYKESY